MPTSQKMDFVKRLWTNHNKNNHSEKDAEAKDRPLIKVRGYLWKCKTYYAIGNYFIDYNPVILTSMEFEVFKQSTEKLRQGLGHHQL